jgi:hypothetical protein
MQACDALPDDDPMKNASVFIKEQIVKSQAETN